MLDDAAQGFGATYKGRKLGTLRPRDRDELLPGQAARLLRRRRRGLHRRRRAGRNRCAACACTARAPTNTTMCGIGITGRLDTMQAAILIEKLKIFADEIAARNAVGAGATPRRSAMSRPCRSCRTDCTSVWAQYTIRLRPARPRRARRGAEGAGHSDRDLLSEAAAPADGLSGISRSPTAACR